MNSFKMDHYNPSVYHLTLSILLKHHPKYLIQLIKIQDKLTEGLSYSTYPNNNALYKYFADSLHFSIINFATAAMPDNDSRQEFDNKYHELIAKLMGKIPPLLGEFNSWGLKVDQLYVGRETKSPTISANVVLKNKIKEDLKEKLSELLSSSEFEADKALKFYTSSNNFAVNLVRVFRKLSDEEEDELIKRVNRGFKPFDLKMSRLSLVVSNNYLSNSDPEIAHFIL